MKNNFILYVYFFIITLIISPLFSPVFALASKTHVTSTQEILQNITPRNELKRLIEGNFRFVHNKSIQRNLLQQAKTTSLQGQFPASVILSCMDSRSVPELILDQGLGDIFSVRVAGNVIDTDQIASMEYATQVIGSKLIVVMGHTQCGAIKSACQQVQLGNITTLLNKIEPAVNKIKTVSNKKLDCNNKKTIDDIAKQNVLNMIQLIEEKSPIIHHQLNTKKILIVGAIHNLFNGKIIFFDKKGKEYH